MVRSSIWFLAMPLVLVSCGDRQDRKPAPPPLADYRALKSVAQVERIVPPELRTPYQQLFGCTFDLAAKRGRPAPRIDPAFSGRILETVRADPDAGAACLRELRS